MGRGIKGEGKEFVLPVANPKSPAPAGLVPQPWIGATCPRMALAVAPLASPRQPTSKSSLPDLSCSPGNIPRVAQWRARVDKCSYQAEILVPLFPPKLAIEKARPSVPGDSNRSR